ncbi:MAG: hypothetical protein MHM6MM_002292 [Cercozoa sp. M6MM]
MQELGDFRSTAEATCVYVWRGVDGKLETSKGLPTEATGRLVLLSKPEGDWDPTAVSRVKLPAGFQGLNSSNTKWSRAPGPHFKSALATEEFESEATSFNTLHKKHVEYSAKLVELFEYCLPDDEKALQTYIERCGQAFLEAPDCTALQNLVTTPDQLQPADVIAGCAAIRTVRRNLLRLRELKFAAEIKCKILSAISDTLSRLDTSLDTNALVTAFASLLGCFEGILKCKTSVDLRPTVTHFLKIGVASVAARGAELLDGESFMSKLDALDFVECQNILDSGKQMCEAAESLPAKILDAVDYEISEEVLLPILRLKERVNVDVQEFLRIFIGFSKLDKIAIGGSEGNEMSVLLAQCYTDFRFAFDKIKENAQDMFDASTSEFDEAFWTFRNKILELDRRLTEICRTALNNNEHASCALFSVVESIDSLLLRNALTECIFENKEVFWNKLVKLLQNIELSECEQTPGMPAQKLFTLFAQLRRCSSIKERLALLKVEGSGVTRDDLNKWMQQLNSKLSAAAVTELDKLCNEVVDVDLSRPAITVRESDDSETGVYTCGMDPNLRALMHLARVLHENGILQVSDARLNSLCAVARKSNRSYRELVVFARTQNENLRKTSRSSKLVLEKEFAELESLLEEKGGEATFVSPLTGVLSDQLVGCAFSIQSSAQELSSAVDDLCERLRKLPFEFDTARKEQLDFEEFRAVWVEFLQQREVELKAIFSEAGVALHSISKSASKYSPSPTAVKEFVSDANNRLCSELSVLCQRISGFLLRILCNPEDGVPLLRVPLRLLSAGDNRWECTISASSRKQSIWDQLQMCFSQITDVANDIPPLVEEVSPSHVLENDAEIKGLEDKFKTCLEQTRSSYNELLQQLSKYEFLHGKDRNDDFEIWCKSLGRNGVQITEQLEGIPAVTEEGKDKEIADVKLFGANENELPSLKAFISRTEFFFRVRDNIQALPSFFDTRLLRIDMEETKSAFATLCSEWSEMSFMFLQRDTKKKTLLFSIFVKRAQRCIEKIEKTLLANKKPTMKAVAQLLVTRANVLEKERRFKGMFEPLSDVREALQQRFENISIVDDEAALERLPRDIEDVVERTAEISNQLSNELERLRDRAQKMTWAELEALQGFRKEFVKEAPSRMEGEDFDRAVPEAYRSLSSLDAEVRTWESRVEALKLREQYCAEPSERSSVSQLEMCDHEASLLKGLWDAISFSATLFKSYSRTPWNDVQPDVLLGEIKKLAKQVRGLPKECRAWAACATLDDVVKRWQRVLPLVTLLRSPSLEKRHWQKLVELFGIDTEMPQFLSDILRDVDQAAVEEVVDQSEKEFKIAKQLTRMKETWIEGDDVLKFEFDSESNARCTVVKVTEEILTSLEESISVVQGIIAQGASADYFAVETEALSTQLSTTEAVLQDWISVQSRWLSLETIFRSEDIREQLPEDAERFSKIDSEYIEFMEHAKTIDRVLEACCEKNRGLKLERLKAELELTEKSLNNYLEAKKILCPRFYFLSSSALLSLLSNGNNPQMVQTEVSDCFDNVSKLEFKDEHSKDAIGMHSKDGDEYVEFTTECHCEGNVEDWINEAIGVMRKTLKDKLRVAKNGADQWGIEKSRPEWLMDHCAQIALTTSQIIWTEEVEAAFLSLEDGDENAMKEYSKVLEERLGDLIELTLKDLNREIRTKVITLITVDVHNRDVVQALVKNNIIESTEFAWKSQMRYSWKNLDTGVSVADASFPYGYEYVGNTGRLVITPLTDRCYITLTTALSLIMGAAPAGPAGTGKTETTKDLGRALALPVYVFNCSEQMNVHSLGQIFKGLCQTGAWGCFDEFNRIPVEVLSVVATQFGSILSAIKARKERFDFMGQEIKLEASVGCFITMNPGYAGRTELPENLKALFRSCAMVVPDIMLICENMLLSEGFLRARPLAIKFTKLYALAKELLSAQPHYDWGLRATKAVLRVAGGLKRAEPDVEESKILMRALRDFNLPKITALDRPVFLRLIDDLFRGLQVERQVDKSLEEAALAVTKERGLEPDPAFLQKVAELGELLEIRHSVFVIGGPGTGKTEVWKTLTGAYNRLGQPAVYEAFNPKAIKNDEIYGWLAASDWKDGMLSSLMRNMSRCVPPFTHAQKWKLIILDGPIDPEWIESLNTVMDDNKVLTLVSNERIPLSDSMRLVFEIGDLANATPATVSRAGVIFINQNDIGWRPFVDKWIRSRPSSEHSVLQKLFGKYLTSRNLEHFTRTFEHVVPRQLLSFIRAMVQILEGLITSSNMNDTSCFENFFIMAFIWSFGATLRVDQERNDREVFSDWVLSLTEESVPWPEMDTTAETKLNVFDWTIDPSGKTFRSWNQLIGPEDNYFEPSGDVVIRNIVVETAQTKMLQYFFNLTQKRKDASPFMCVGVGGTGKTVMLSHCLRKQQSPFVTIGLNAISTEGSLRSIQEQSLEKKSGRIYGPKESRLTFLIEDINMPEPSAYGTQATTNHILQHLDYGFWYDIDRIERKEIHDTYYAATMNQTSGSFFINPRLQDRFISFNCSRPSSEEIKSIFVPLVENYMPFGEKDRDDAHEISKNLVAASIALLEQMSATFKPSSTKFWYLFSLHEIANMTQGLLMMTKPLDSEQRCQLWKHEAARVFGDKLNGAADMEKFHSLLEATAMANFPECATKEYPRFSVVSDSNNAETEDYHANDDEKLRVAIESALSDYNDDQRYTAMPLVLFEEAISHVTKIARIFTLPRGNALLIGVGGSGRRSLCRLAAFACGMSIFTLTITRTYSSADLLEDIRGLFVRAGLKNEKICWILADSGYQEEWYVYINDYLATGKIPDLYTSEDLDGIIDSMRNEAKQAGIPSEDREGIFNLFISRVRRNLKLALCFSPVGPAFRLKCGRFPSILNSTVMDTFESWPLDALQSVARRFLDLDDQEQRDKLADHLADVHLSVSKVAVKFKEACGRETFTTPRSFLELISYFKTLLQTKRDSIDLEIERLDKGVATLMKTSRDVKELKADLAQTLKIVEEKSTSASKLIEECGKERAHVEKQKEAANVEADKAKVIAEKSEAIKQECDKELAAAQPALEAAAEAVQCLSKDSLTQLKSFKTPSDAIVDVTKAVLILKENERRDFSWKRACAMMGNVGRFMQELAAFDATQIPEDTLSLLQPILDIEHFNPEGMSRVSSAAASLCTWVIAIVKYNKIYKYVKPKMLAAESAAAEVAEANAVVDKLMNEVAELEAGLAKVTRSLEQAIEEKNQVEQQAQRCKDRLNLAERLINGLSSEGDRWREGIRQLNDRRGTLIGNSALAAAFVIYAGPFDAFFRSKLVEEWFEGIKNRSLPVGDEITPLNYLANDANFARWTNEGLPVDNTSLENAAIVSESDRYPLFIDPQLTAAKWIKQRVDNLLVVSAGKGKWLQNISRAIQDGRTVFLENVGETIDSSLDPVLSKSFKKKGRSLYLYFAGEEIMVDPQFRLFLCSRLSNPVYSPEVFSQCSVINFLVTPEQLKHQLLALVVNKERPELEEERSALVRSINADRVRLAELENELLLKLSNAPEDILSDVALVEGLEHTKKTAVEIEKRVSEAKVKEIEINNLRNQYSSVAFEASQLYFLLTELYQVSYMYRYSLEEFIRYFYKSIREAEVAEKTPQRVQNLCLSLRLTIFRWVARGCFADHKLILAAQMLFTLMRGGALPGFDEARFDFLLRAPRKFNQESPFPWLPVGCYNAAMKLSELSGFEKLIKDMKSSTKRFEEWYNHPNAFNEPLPLEYRKLDEDDLFAKLLICRCLRPDQMPSALRRFCTESLPHGEMYINLDAGMSFDDVLTDSIRDSLPEVPIFLVLTPGSDPISALAAAAEKLHGSENSVHIHRISMGQGQESVAASKMADAVKKGDWVALENIHLMPRWCALLDKEIEELKGQEDVHENFRLFLSAEPSKLMPATLLQKSIVLVSEPPSGLKANLSRAFASFSRDAFEFRSQKEKTMLFSLALCHAIFIERKRFGAQGWNAVYPFGAADLRDAAAVLSKYMESGGDTIPWRDLRYIFSEIIWGGHITDGRDRIVATTYMEHYLKEEIFDGAELSPYLSDQDASSGYSFNSPPVMPFDDYFRYIESKLRFESPIYFGLHPNVDLKLQMEYANTVFEYILALNASGTAVGGAASTSTNARVDRMIESIQETIEGIDFDMDTIESVVPAERDPYQTVFLQECEQMCRLVNIMRKDCSDLTLARQGKLSMTTTLEEMQHSIFMNRVPSKWEKNACPSLRALGAWIEDLMQRANQLRSWVDDPQNIPLVVDLSLFFKPQSFLTAVMQVSAQRNNLDLDSLSLLTDVTKKKPQEIESRPRDGVYCKLGYLQGASWDSSAGVISDAVHGEMLTELPVVNIRSVPSDRLDASGIFGCPVYRTEQRGPTFIMESRLKTKDAPEKWILAGAAVILEKL